MKSALWIKALFYLAFLYDGVLGVAFLLYPLKVFATFDVAPPNHFGYAQFPGALLIIFSLMFLSVAREPFRNYILIPYGMLLKVAYCSIVFAYWFSGGIPGMWKPFAVIDLAFLALFGLAFVQLRTKSS